ncbi:hypothetical protein BDZ91DRAFT_89745 [Kalaharituber pfeilii]|nr:hypothetical protein BDZ91DRAFT_89745 [Kalaharituber pfeilii]
MYIPIRSNKQTASPGHVMSAHHIEYYGSEKREHLKPMSREQHKGIPPAVAALLAVTAIPVAPRKAQRNGRPRKTALDIYVERSPPEADHAVLVDNCIIVDDIVDDTGLIFGSPVDNEFDDKDFCSLSVRSVSSDSVPSLEADDAASTFSWSGPTTPKERPDRKSRPLPENCALDHPLMFNKEAVAVLSQETTIPPPQGFRRVLSFRSNLTASLRVLKSAAKSFSSFSAPLLQPDDLLTRNIFSNTPRYADEKRPRLSKEIPTPALRRYLNPSTSASQDTRCTGAIQMQTYNRVRRVPRQKTRPIQMPRTDEGDMPRPREPRENSDFLRVIVLEMNMRRGGKLCDTAQGKARLVLPPRQVSKNPRAIGDLPRRWEVLACE